MLLFWYDGWGRRLSLQSLQPHFLILGLVLLQNRFQAFPEFLFTLNSFPFFTIFKQCLHQKHHVRWRLCHLWRCYRGTWAWILCLVSMLVVLIWNVINIINVTARAWNCIIWNAVSRCAFSWNRVSYKTLTYFLVQVSTIPDARNILVAREIVRNPSNCNQLLIHLAFSLRELSCCPSRYNLF